MTKYPPLDALRARIRGARSQDHVVTSPTIATLRFQVAAETLLGPLLRHAAHVLWRAETTIRDRYDRKSAGSQYVFSTICWSIPRRGGTRPSPSKPWSISSKPHANLRRHGAGMTTS